MKNRLGTFVISRAVIDDFPEKAMEILSNVLVVRAECNYAYDIIEYTAMSELFEVVTKGAKIPLYEVITYDNNDTFEFRKI